MLSVFHCQLILLLHHSSTNFILWTHPSLPTTSQGIKKKGNLALFHHHTFEQLLGSEIPCSEGGGKADHMVRTLSGNEANSYQRAKEQNAAGKRNGKLKVSRSTQQPTGKLVPFVSWKNRLRYKESSYLLCNFQAVKSKLIILLSLKLKISSGKTLVWKQIELQAF